MNDQCHDCKIRKLCYLEEPEEDWTCDHYEPCEYDEEDVTDINVGNKDTISRQAVKEILDKYQLRYHIYPYVWDAINELPPAQLGTNLAEVGTDCISRQAAIDIVNHSRFGMQKMTFDIVTIALNDLPPAQPERIKGHWIEIALSNHTYKCSVCGRLLVNITDGKNNVAKNYPYCHCGADMRGEQK